MEHEFTLIIANDLAVGPEFTDPDSPGFLALQNDQRSSGRLARQRITPHAAPLKGGTATAGEEFLGQLLF
jgi:hypothetical protein